MLLNGVCVSEFLADLEESRGGGGMKEEELGRLNAEEGWELEACGTYCFWKILPLTKNLLYKSYNDK